MMRSEAIKRMGCVLAAAVMTVLLCVAFACADGEGALTAEADLGHINQYGNIELMKDGAYLLYGDFEKAGIDYGDVVTVSFLDKSVNMPVVNAYAEVENGVAVLCIQEDKSTIAINMGDFASEYIADKSTFEDHSFSWAYKKGIKGPVVFTITMKTKGGFYDEHGNGQLRYSDEKTDFPDLTDEEFANFRPVITRGMGRNTLYRTSSPVNPEHKRNTFADAALKRAGVRTVVNMADDKDKVRSYEGYDRSYYSTTDYIPLNMGINIYSDDFSDKFAEGLRFIASHKGPYAVHCNEGKDRAGFAAAMLELFMGATYDDVVRDYMVSYYNYYGIEPDDERYNTIAEENIGNYLRELYKTDDLRKADLAAETEKYFREIGLNDAEIEALRTNLSESYTSVTEIVLTIAGGLAVIITALYFAAVRGRR